MAHIDVVAAPARSGRVGLERLGARHALRPIAERAIRPDVDFANVADRAGLNVFDDGARVVGGVALVAHLRRDFRFLRALGKLARFGDGPRQRLLHVDGFLQIHRGERDRRVHVIGGRDENRVDVFLLVEHLAIVGIALEFREVHVFQALHSLDANLCALGVEGLEAGGDLLWRQHRRIFEALLRGFDFGVEAVEAFVGVAPIDVADGDDILVGEIDEIRAAHAADADAGDVEQIAGRRVAAAENMARHDRESGRGCGGFRDKRAAGNCGRVRIRLIVSCDVSDEGVVSSRGVAVGSGFRVINGLRLIALLRDCEAYYGAWLNVFENV